MKKKIISVIIAFFAMIFSLNVLSCQGRASKAQLDSERTSNEESGLGRLTNEEVENERKQNEEAGLGRLTDAEVENEREANENAGLGRLTNTELEAIKLKPQDVPDGYVLVEGGTFVRKTTYYTDSYDIETDYKTAAVCTFMIGSTEVTQKLYESIMGKNPSEFRGSNHPVESVSWYDAVEFCNSLSKKDGLTPCYTKKSNGEYTWNKNTDGWRLPTEIEWRYAARGGNKSKGYKFSGSNNVDEVAWHSGNIRSFSTQDVATKAPNELGIYDMSGNVFEWVWDEKDGSICGGNCISDVGIIACDVSFINWYSTPGKGLGFRIVRSAPISIEPKKVMTAGANLKLRSAEATSSEVLTTMQAGTKVKILELGKSETIDEIDSNWVKVEVQADAKDRDGNPIEKGLSGWCYGGYLTTI